MAGQKVDIAVRLVTSSNHDLEAAGRDGRFRDDLLYRVNTVTVSLPPLRERGVDIPLLAHHFLTHIAGASAPILSADAIAGAMRAAISAACRPGVRAITAGNYGGKLGPYHFHLHQIMTGVA